MNMRKEDGEMGKTRKTEGRFLCHIWEMEDAEKAGCDLKLDTIKSYGSWWRIPPIKQGHRRGEGGVSG